MITSQVKSVFTEFLTILTDKNPLLRTKPVTERVLTHPAWPKEKCIILGHNELSDLGYFFKCIAENFGSIKNFVHYTVYSAESKRIQSYYVGYNNGYQEVLCGGLNNRTTAAIEINELIRQIFILFTCSFCLSCDYYILEGLTAEEVKIKFGFVK